MSNAQSDIGYYRIDEAYISRYDKSGEPFSISNYIANMSLTESIFSPFVLGTILISDTANIIDNFPIRGEEILTLTYSDFFENKLTQDFLIYGVQSLSPSEQQNSTGYLLQFISPQAIMSFSRDITKSYTGTATDIIKKIFKEYLTEEKTFDNARLEIDTEDSTGVQTVVIPMLSPLAAIEFLKRRAFSDENKSSNYLFFQNRKQFRMVTHEKIIKDARRGENFDKNKIYSHDLGLQMDSLTADLAMNNILSIDFPRRINTIDEIKYGAMASKTVEIDILQKQYRQFPYDFKDNYERYTHLDTDISFNHTTKFMEKYFDNQDNKVVTDMIFADLERPNQYYKEIIPHRRSTSFYLYSGITCTIEVYGRNNLFAGDIIKLNVPEYEVTEGEKKTHRSLSGYWLVQEIIHKLDGKEYRFEMKLSKDLPRNEGVD